MSHCGATQLRVLNYIYYKSLAATVPRRHTANHETLLTALRSLMTVIVRTTGHTHYAANPSLKASRIFFIILFV